MCMHMRMLTRLGWHCVAVLAPALTSQRIAFLVGMKRADDFQLDLKMPTPIAPQQAHPAARYFLKEILLRQYTTLVAAFGLDPPTD